MGERGEGGVIWHIPSSVTLVYHRVVSGRSNGGDRHPSRWLVRGGAGGGGGGEGGAGREGGDVGGGGVYLTLHQRRSTLEMSLTTLCCL